MSFAVMNPRIQVIVYRDGTPIGQRQPLRPGAGKQGEADASTKRVTQADPLGRRAAGWPFAVLCWLGMARHLTLRGERPESR